MMSLGALVSPSGTVLAHCSGASGTSTSIALRDAATGRWRNTLASTSSSSSSSSSGGAMTIRKLAFADDDRHLVAWRRGSVTVWDVTRGVVACQISSCSSSSTIGNNNDIDNNNKNFTVWDVATTTTNNTNSTNTNGGGTLVLAVTKKVTTNHHHHHKKKKIVLHEYAAATGKLQRKIKGAGKVTIDTTAGDDAPAIGAATVQLAVTEQHFVVRAANSVRVLCRETGTQVSKVSLSSLDSDDDSDIVGGDDNNNMLLVQGDLGCVLDANSGRVVLFRLSTGKILKPASGSSSALRLPVKKNPNNCDTLNQLIQDNDSGANAFWLLRGDSLLASIELQDNSNTYTARTVSVDAASSGAQDRVCLVLLPTPRCRILAVQIGGSGGHNDCRVQHVELPAANSEDDDDESSSSKRLQIAWRKSEETKDNNENKNRKRGAATVLGPGQVGGEARGATEAIRSSSSSSNKRSKVVAAAEGENDNQEGEEDDEDDDDDTGPTLAERLQQLQEAMDQEEDDDQRDDSRMQREGDDEDNDEDKKFVPQQATTESLTQLLQQSLQSGDSAMLEMALQVRDPAILSESCRQLEPHHVQSLVVALTTRLALKPARADHLCRWLTAVLQSSSSTDSVEHLQPLQNLLQERLEVFPMLLQLEGRLARMSED